MLLLFIAKLNTTFKENRTHTLNAPSVRSIEIVFILKLTKIYLY